MRFRPVALIAATALLAGGCAGALQGNRAGAPPPLAIEQFGSVNPADARLLIVVLPGDPALGEAGDAYAFAGAAAAAIPAARAIVVIRPGHHDRHGRASPGLPEAGIGDGFTPDRLRPIGDTLAMLRARHRTARIVLVGQGSGAAAAADLAAMRPGLVDGMVLAGCPCSLPEWRRHMKRLRPAEAWDAPVTSLDPLRLAGGIDPALRSAIIVGAEDRITPPRYSRAYAEALALRGIATDFRILPDRGHAVLNEPDVLAATQRLAASLPPVRR